jgi:hypothetical protein
MKSIATVAFSFAAILPLVAAHGFIQDMKVDGKLFKSSPPNGQQTPSAIRQVSSIEPIKGAKNPDINCGPSAKPASLSADAMPGSKLEFNWRGGDGSNWPHNIGPMFTYLTSCGNVTCDKFDPSNATWFKLEESGKKPNSAQWVQQDLKDGGVATMTLPSDLAPGNYIARHEIIALHLGTQMGGAEFYAGCAQLRVGGNETGVPDPNQLVQLPGAYTDSDPGIFTPDVFNSGFNYVFPGPPVAKLADGGNGNNTQPSAPSNPKHHHCQIVNQGALMRPRQVSRVMRNLAIH